MATYSSQATKGITRAIPTVNVDGNVTKWEIEAVYSLNGFKSDYRDDVKAGEFTPKAPSEFTKEELWALCPVHQWNKMFDSQYKASVVDDDQTPAEEVKADFDVHTLSTSAE